ncbi:MULTISPECIES: hypothetical protein [unclassified Candidatus Paralachnospira]|uniref:hypothetical protein n=1 Tax=unclassified Candidatus Paralachnospira TaxID=3099471 RepID=UPI003F90C5CC
MTDKPTRFVEMDWREALRKYADGYDVLRMDVEPRPGKVAPDYITDSLDDVLQGYHYMVDQMSGPEEAESQEEKEAAGSDEDQSSVQKPKARRQYINAEDKEAITELYKAGREMEEIAEALGLYLSAVSRYIKEAGLGDERYKGKVIPSTGSAPVTAAVYNGGTGKKGN